VESTAEAILGDTVLGEQREIRRAVQLDLPVIIGASIPILYMQMDGTGIPVVKQETVGRQGKIDGQPAHTREAKLECVFTQTTWDAEGYAIRDPDCTTYTGAVETAEEFGKRLYLEAWNRGWSRAQKKVVMGDGAEWIWNLAERHLPGAIQIVDLYHARQHLWELAHKLHPQRRKQSESLSFGENMSLAAPGLSRVGHQFAQFPIEDCHWLVPQTSSTNGVTPDLGRLLQPRNCGERVLNTQPLEQLLVLRLIPPVRVGQNRAGFPETRGKTAGRPLHRVPVPVPLAAHKDHGHGYAGAVPSSAKTSGLVDRRHCRTHPLGLAILQSDC
jgi:hypothetical protein